MQAHWQGFKLGLKGEGSDTEPAHDKVWDSMAKLEEQGASRGSQPAASYDDEGNTETKGKHFKGIKVIFQEGKKTICSAEVPLYQ